MPVCSRDPPSMSTRSGFMAASLALVVAVLAPLPAAAQQPAVADVAQQPAPAPSNVLRQAPLSPSTSSGQAAAETPATPLPAVTVCGQTRTPAAQPPAGSGPVVLYIAPCFAKQGGTSVIEPQTYVYYIQLKFSQPSQGIWVPYDGAAEKIIHEDFSRLLATKFLDDLSIETEDYTFPNGAVGKIVLYKMEERQRVKAFDFEGTKKIETSKIDERLKDQNAEI